MPSNRPTDGDQVTVSYDNLQEYNEAIINVNEESSTNAGLEQQIADVTEESVVNDAQFQNQGTGIYCWTLFGFLFFVTLFFFVLNVSMGALVLICITPGLVKYFFLEKLIISNYFTFLHLVFSKKTSFMGIVI